MKSVLREHRQYALKPFIVDAEEEPTGGWLIIRPDGIRFHLTDEDFKRHYDPVEDTAEQQDERVSYQEMAERLGSARRVVDVTYQELRKTAAKLECYVRMAKVVADGQITKGEMIAMADSLIEGDTALLDKYESWMLPKEGKDANDC